ncbi:unnamed protein product [Heterobilharzia americana]|nr:unnamed protein product [Heterobilharzia americana]CAH8452182.1 unnamed protein product [Heterobilharzia americana]
MVKKRMQVRGFEEARIQFGQIPNRQGGLWRCLVEIWKVEGAAAIFKGLQCTNRFADFFFITIIHKLISVFCEIVYYVCVIHSEF